MSERNHPPLEQLIDLILFQDLPGLLALFKPQTDAVHTYPAPPEPIQLLATPVLVLYAPPPTLALDAGVAVNSVPAPKFPVVVASNVAAAPEPIAVVNLSSSPSSDNSKPQYLGLLYNPCGANGPPNFCCRRYAFLAEDVFEYARHIHIWAEDFKGLVLYLLARMQRYFVRFPARSPSMFNHCRALVLNIVDLVHDLFTNPYTTR
ncbi:hypothetical protein PPACK8108_LOCUS25123 [Phakopsora pachyrhizi]|uniref:Uncharacterized protein n=1 Tax=Phakopsora pachyrhizi TaxID=170000 RepID=A0AAV0BT43_PHAPC|nr:hypothetical protein PPACK8108_LOCUS25123 [Phakopsora pachyrhizi]